MKEVLNNYWDDVDVNLSRLLETGYVKLPSLSEFPLNDWSENIVSEMGGKTFVESSFAHEQILDSLGIREMLAPKLFEIATNKLGYGGDISNQYHIARRVDAGNSIEKYRAHFDSHLFTLVIPLKIPVASADGSSGDLIFFPQARKSPSNELRNFVSKIYFKQFGSQKGLAKLSCQKTHVLEDFQDCRPLLFIGNTTLHANKEVSLDCSTYRLTLLAHFFDPSPKIGVGSVMRFLRGR